MKAYELKQGWRAAVLALSVMLAACGSDDQANNSGVVGGGTAISPSGVVGGASNCTTPYGQPGVLTNNGYGQQQVCLPSNANAACANPIYNQIPQYGAQQVMMCPCTGAIVAQQGMTMCNGNQSFLVSNNYFFVVTPNAVNPYYQGQSYGNCYRWMGNAWYWVCQ